MGPFRHRLTRLSTPSLTTAMSMRRGSFMPRDRRRKVRRRGSDGTAPLGNDTLLIGDVHRPSSFRPWKPLRVRVRLAVNQDHSHVAQLHFPCLACFLRAARLASVHRRTACRACGHRLDLCSLWNFGPGERNDLSVLRAGPCDQAEHRLDDPAQLAGPHSCHGRHIRRRPLLRASLNRVSAPAGRLARRYTPIAVEAGNVRRHTAGRCGPPLLPFFLSLETSLRHRMSRTSCQVRNVSPLLGKLLAVESSTAI